MRTSQTILRLLDLRSLREIPCKSDGDARRLAWSVASLRVWDRKSLHLAIEVSLSIVHKEMYKKCRDVCFSMISFKGQFKFETDPHWSPLGAKF